MRLDRSAIVIRDARHTDIPALSVLLVQSFNPDIEGSMGYLLHTLLRLSIQTDLKQRFRTHRHRTNQYCCIVAVCSQGMGSTAERVVGTVEMSQRHQYVWPTSSRYMYISNLAVQSQYRRQGIAVSLLKACEEAAVRWGFSILHLHVREDNQAARYLYEQVGYRIKRIDFNLGTLILQQPRTLLLYKQLRMERV